MYVDQRTVSINTIKTNCCSLFVKLCSDSCRHETRLPGLLSHPCCAAYVPAMKLCFLFSHDFQQLAALFGGCGFGQFESVYVKLSDFCFNAEHSSEITFNLLGLML